MYNFLEKFDGTGRIPRDVQKLGLEWLGDNFNNGKHKVIKGPVGLGKSAISRAIQLVTRAHVITPSNTLINQYIESYPETNYLKGKSHYSCGSGVSCEEWTNVFDQKPCPSCPYQVSKMRSMKGVPTFFNPMSLYYSKAQSDVLVVDEAHQLPGMILMLCGSEFSKSKYGYPQDATNQVQLVKWLKSLVTKLYRLQIGYMERGDTVSKSKLGAVSSEIEKINLVVNGIEEQPENYAVWEESRTVRGRKEWYLKVKPITPPRFLCDAILRADRIVLMSGTMFDCDVKTLLGDKEYESIDLPSPIPVANRPVFYRPVDFKMNYQTDPALIAHSIEKVLESYPGKNAIIHVPYSMSKKLQPHFKYKVLTNTAQTKDQVLERFKKFGGVWLASGCSEGLDLKGDLARVNIIPKLAFPDLNDPVVKKRKALEGGAEWYGLETLKTLIQQVGRTTRSADDWSHSIVLDPMFPRLFSKLKDKLPQSFTEQIEWRKG